MYIADLISSAVPHLKPGDTAGFALDTIERANTPQLAVVEAGKYQGMLAESVLLDADPDAMVHSLPLYANLASISGDRHPFDLYRMAEENSLDVVAVHDADNQYSGSVLVADALRALAKSYALQQNGGILIVGVYERDYSLHHLSRLIESNNVRVLATMTDVDPEDPQRLLVTLKLNQTDLSRTIATLERFGMEVAQQFHQPEVPNVDQERLDLLMKYLSI